MDFITTHIVRVIWGILLILGLLFLIALIVDMIKYKDKLERETNGITVTIIGFVVNFFDTLGIGSFAPTTALLKAFKQSQDRHIPGILNVGCCIPVITEALIFIEKVEVEPITLFSMLVASAIGAYFGAGIISRISEQKIRLIMGFALFVTAILMIFGMAGLMPVGGEAVGLTGAKLVVAIVCNFILGVLMTAGIGLYAPCMALVYMLGMSPLVAFPIMMGSCAMLMPVASFRFIKEGAYNRKASFGIMVGGIVGVFIAAYLVTSLPLFWLRILVICVIFYTSFIMLRAYFKGRPEVAAQVQ